MAIMLKEIINNETPPQYTFSGIILGPPRCRLIARELAYNDTLVALHLARKQIKDPEGEEIARMLDAICQSHFEWFSRERW